MRLIALEEHMLTPRVARVAQIAPRGLLGAKLAALTDLGRARLDGMDAAGIDVQVLSAVGSLVQGLEPARSTDLARHLNDTMAEAVRQHPERFRAFATLPMTDPAAAAAELYRAVHDLGFVGAMVHGQTRGTFLDDPSVEPVLAVAAERGVPLYLHPAPPPPAVAAAYFSGLAPAVADMLACGGWGWHTECGLHVLRMVVGGVFERHPQLQVVVGHMGENLPFSLARADEWLSPLADGLSESVADTVRHHVHITISGYTTVPPLLCALLVFGAQRMMFAVDHPFSDNAHTARFLADAPLSPTDRELIAHGNAERLFAAALHSTDAI